MPTISQLHAAMVAKAREELREAEERRIVAEADVIEARLQLAAAIEVEHKHRRDGPPCHSA
jgi:hypothetical protein